MDWNEANEFERQVDQELKALPELTAPRELMPRVLAVIAARAAVPWYRRAWTAWPLALRMAALALLMAIVSGLGYASWALCQTAPAVALTQQAGHWLAGIAAMCRGITVLPAVAVAVLKKLDHRVLLGCLAAIALAYASCVGAVACYIRLGLARNRNWIS